MPPLFTRLKISTTTSMDLSSPVTSSKCRSIRPTVAIALSRLTASSNEIDRSGIALSFFTYGPMPRRINSVTSIHMGSSSIRLGW